MSIKLLSGAQILLVCKDNSWFDIGGNIMTLLRIHTCDKTRALKNRSKFVYLSFSYNLNYYSNCVHNFLEIQ